MRVNGILNLRLRRGMGENESNVFEIRFYVYTRYLLYQKEFPVLIVYLFIWHLCYMLHFQSQG